MAVSPTPVDVSWMIRTIVDGRLTIESARTKATTNILATSKTSLASVLYTDLVFFCTEWRREKFVWRTSSSCSVYLLDCVSLCCDPVTMPQKNSASEQHKT